MGTLGRVNAWKGVEGQARSLCSSDAMVRLVPQAHVFVPKETDMPFSSKESSTLLSTSRMRKQTSTCWLDRASGLGTNAHPTCQNHVQCSHASTGAPGGTWAQSTTMANYLEKHITERDGIRRQLRLSHPGSGSKMVDT